MLNNLISDLQQFTQNTENSEISFLSDCIVFLNAMKEEDEEKFYQKLDEIYKPNISSQSQSGNFGLLKRIKDMHTLYVGFLNKQEDQQGTETARILVSQEIQDITNTLQRAIRIKKFASQAVSPLQETKNRRPNPNWRLKLKMPWEQLGRLGQRRWVNSLEVLLQKQPVRLMLLGSLNQYKAWKDLCDSEYEQNNFRRIVKLHWSFQIVGGYLIETVPWNTLNDKLQHAWYEQIFQLKPVQEVLNASKDTTTVDSQRGYFMSLLNDGGIPSLVRYLSTIDFLKESCIKGALGILTLYSAIVKQLDQLACLSKEDKVILCKNTKKFRDEMTAYPVVFSPEDKQEMQILLQKLDNIFQFQQQLLDCLDSIKIATPPNQQLTQKETAQRRLYNYLSEKINSNPVLSASEQGALAKILIQEVIQAVKHDSNLKIGFFNLKPCLPVAQLKDRFLALLQENPPNENNRSLKNYL
jgi:hypothetical protein